MRTIKAIVLACCLALSAGASASAQSALDAPASRARIIMMRMVVSDLASGEAFYASVLGARLVGEIMDGRARVMILPDGPGLILIPEEPAIARLNTSFIVQVADLEETLNHALSRGAVLIERYNSVEQGVPAQSAVFDDPFGNQIEVLQMGAPAQTSTGR